MDRRRPNLMASPTLWQRVAARAGVLVVLLVVSAALPAAASLAPRTLLFSHLTDLEGIGEAPINAITQDRQGYLWYGTQEGLKRYDGIEIVTYEREYDEPNSLSSDWVWSIYVDNDGVLWVGTEGGGLNRFNRDTDSFIHYQHDSENPDTLSSDRVRVVYQDKMGVHWIGTDGGGLNRLDAATGRFTRFQHDPGASDSLPDDTVLAITEDRAGNLWVGTNGGGLSRLDRSTGRFTHFQHNPSDASSLSDNHVRAIYEDRTGRLWVGTYEGGLNLFDPVSGAFRHFRHDPEDPVSLSNNRVRNIIEDHDGVLWVGTDGGLNEWRPSEQGFAHYVYNSADNSTLSDNRVTVMFQDRGGVLWVGTYNGLNSWNYLSDAFTYYQDNGTAISLSSNIITAVAESTNGELWVGTYGGGLNRVDLADASTSVIDSASADTPERRLPNDRVMVLHVDQNQMLWVGTRGGGLSRLDPNTGLFTHFVHDPQDPNTLSSNNVTSILSSAHGTLWVGTYGGGLNRLDSLTGKVTHYRHDPEDANSLGGDRVLALYRDRGGNLWIGTERGGLNRFNEASRTFERIRHNPNQPESLSADSAWAVLESSDGSLWVGTNGGGLNRWSAADRVAGRQRFRKFRKSDGLRSDAIQAIQEDNAGYLWISTNRGLVRFDPADGDTRHFSRNSGLKGSEFNFGASLRGRSGRLYFGGTSGLVSFDPNRIMTNRHQPEIVLGAFDRQGPIGTRYSIEADDRELEIDYRDDLITFEFAGLDYSAPLRNSYRYQLQGFDPQWSETREFKRATYTNLPPGDYNFVVQAANNDGVWNEEGVSMRLYVLPPPWRTLWAYALYALIALGSVALFLRIQAQKLRWETAQREELEHLVSARTDELAQRNDQLLSLNQQLKESSWTDSLTGLKNRRFLDEFIQQEVAYALRHNNDTKMSPESLSTLDIAPALSFLMIDLDGFKAINDQYGHHAGDAALIHVRDVLNRCCRKSDTIIRWGGDEFLVVGRSTSNRAAEKLAERIRVELAEHEFTLDDGVIVRLSASIGFACYPFSPLHPEIATWEQVWGIADQCAYLAKENGRNAWVGIYGNRETTAQDVADLGNSVERLVNKGVVGLRTSIYQPLAFASQRQIETT